MTYNADNVKNILVNVRSFSGKEVTGVQRYTSEILERIDRNLRLVDSPAIAKSNIAGHLWEQAALPLKSHGLLWSPSNTGPLTVERQVLTIHDMATIDHPEWFEGKFALWYRWLLPRLARRVRHIITVSEYSKSRIVYHAGVSPEKITVTHLAADARFKPLAIEDKQEAQNRLKLPKRYILSVGSLQARKNLARLFEAWRTWDNRPLRLKLVVVGGSQGIFKNIGVDGLPDGVVMLGRVDDADLPALYALAESFIYPSLYEGFGLPPLEAMMCGTPVITSNVTSLPEVVGSAALTIDPLETGSIVSALDRLTADPALRSELSAQGLEHARQFSWDKTAQQTLEVLRREAQAL